MRRIVILTTLVVDIIAAIVLVSAGIITTAMGIAYPTIQYYRIENAPLTTCLVGEDSAW